MRKPSFFRWVGLCTLAATLGAIAFGGDVQAQSLAELAQKAKEAREKAEADRAKAAADAKPSTEASAPSASTDGNATSTDAKKKPAPKIYNDQSLRELPPSADTAPALSKPVEQPTTTSAVPSTATPTAPKADGEVVKDESWWRARMTGLRATLQQAQTEYDAKARLVIRLEGVRDNVPERGFSVAQAYAAASAELAKAKADLDVAAGAVRAAKAAIDAAEEEARVANVLPGWLR